MGAGAPPGPNGREEKNSRSGSPIPVPPSPHDAPPVTTTPPPGAPDGAAAVNGLASPFTGAAGADSGESAAAAKNVVEPLNNRNSLLDITGAPHSAPSVQAAALAARSGGTNVMGHTIGEVQEAIDTMGAPKNDAAGVHKGVTLKDPAEAEREAREREQVESTQTDVDDDDDDDDNVPLGVASDARARLAQQAKLANEERDRQQQRESGVAADLVYSDESDDEEEPSSAGLNQSVQTLNGTPNGTAVSGSPLATSSLPVNGNGSDNAPVSPVTALNSSTRTLKPDISDEATPIPLPTKVAAVTPSSPPFEATHILPATSPIVAEPEPVAAVDLSSPSHSVPPQPETAARSVSGSPEIGVGALAAGAGLVGAGTAAVVGSIAASRTPPLSTPPLGHSPSLSSTSIPAPAVPQAALASPSARSTSLHASPGVVPTPLVPVAPVPTHSTPVSTSTPQLQPAAQISTPPVATSSPSTGGTPSGAGIPAKPPASWTVDDVVQWAQAKGFDESICSKFVEHDISGDVLLELDATLLKELDIPQFGKRVRIASAINELRRPASALSTSSAQPSPIPEGAAAAHQSQQWGGASRSHSVTPSYSAASSPVVDDSHGAWAHGRKVSMTPSTPAIDEAHPMESRAAELPTKLNHIAAVNGGGNGHAPSLSTSSVPVSPATTSGATVVKRESTGSLTHKKKGSLDNKSDRLSFFGRNRKPPPQSPSAAERSASSRIGLGSSAASKPTTTMTAATPDKRVSSQPQAAVGSALRTIGTPDRTGYLKKRGERYNTWKTRFFVLKGSHLYYLKSEAEDRVKGHIDLKGHRIIVDENTNPGSYGFRLVGPGEKPHHFSSAEQGQIRDWMKALMKATIARDYSVPVTSSCNIPTIPLAEAQALQPRPPSPSQIDATQRANRRENVNQLTPRDASVLMSLDTTGSGRRMTSHSGGTPSRPSRDTRRPSMSKSSTGRPSVSQSRPSVASYYPPEDEHHAELLNWVNATLPAQYPRAAQFPNSFISGEVIFLVVKHLSGIEPKPPVPPSAFARDATGQPNVEGLFAMMDCVIDAGIDSAGVSLNEVRAGDPNAIATLLDSVRNWAVPRGLA